MKPIVLIERLSKRYSIGGLHPGYMTFREMVADTLFAPFRALRGMDNPTYQTLWALKNINLKIEEGELVGIIGRNGAGKSTLLKILSRITKPTTGRVALYGRVGSLLEVGTGFHPDLTGRENIFLNGAILGMHRAEIQRKFNQIVAFSEIEQFIETPVKWYSSGMYVRLAFSVAAHLEPEILLMDEVLAVGDAAFQQKCLDKMHEIRQQGRTIFFVSHNMAAVTRLCKRAILLDEGAIISDGPPEQVVNQYLSATWRIGAQRDWPDASKSPGNQVVRLRRARIRNEAGETIAAVDIRHPVGIEITYEALKSGHAFTPVLDVHDDEGVHLFSTHDTASEWQRKPRASGSYTSTAWIPGNLLSEGNFLVDVSFISFSPATALHAQERNVVAFQTVDNQQEGSARGDFIGPIPGVVRPLLMWTTEVSPRS
ncbi:MAG: ABC transporter ATP-binding protein [Acidobacteriia bacterium]|nr:ABC transporter ATP-binding protein [Terriglobia bacterium]